MLSVIVLVVLGNECEAKHENRREQKVGKQREGSYKSAHFLSLDNESDIVS